MIVDGECLLSDSFRAPGALQPTEHTIPLRWAGLKADFDEVVKTYQEPVITESLASLGLACILVAKRAGLEVTEVTRRGERAHDWLGDREFLLEVSGQQSGDLDRLCGDKASQLLENPFGDGGYVCVANYDRQCARLWFYAAKGTES